jgi:serine/threonine protein kinase
MLNALSIVHKQGIVHCDIKPQNFLPFEQHEDIQDCDDCSIDSSDSHLVLKLTDFGLAHIIPSGQTKALMKVRCGTKGYTAPEAKDGCYIDCSLDMWSFGICLYKMAAGYFPSDIAKYDYSK